MTDAGLAVEGLSAWYGEAQVLRDVSLNLGAGEVVTLVGRNGAGKTTLMRAVMGHLPIARGRIEFEGRDLARVARQGRAALGIGYMPEDRGLVPSLSVEENILVPVWASRTLQSAERLAPDRGHRKVLPGVHVAWRVAALPSDAGPCCPRPPSAMLAPRSITTS